MAETQQSFRKATTDHFCQPRGPSKSDRRYLASDEKRKGGLSCFQAPWNCTGKGMLVSLTKELPVDTSPPGGVTNNDNQHDYLDEKSSTPLSFSAGVSRVTFSMALIFDIFLLFIFFKRILNRKPNTGKIQKSFCVKSEPTLWCFVFSWLLKTQTEKKCHILGHLNVQCSSRVTVYILRTNVGYIWIKYTNPNLSYNFFS